jgi:hypothetical protein
MVVVDTVPTSKSSHKLTREILMIIPDSSEYGLDSLSMDKNGAVWAAGRFHLSCKT